MATSTIEDFVLVSLSYFMIVAVVGCLAAFIGKVLMIEERDVDQ